MITLSRPGAAGASLTPPRLALPAIALLLWLGGCFSQGGSVTVEPCTRNGAGCEEDSQCCSNVCQGDPNGGSLTAGICSAGTGGSGGAGAGDGMTCAKDNDCASGLC